MLNEMLAAIRPGSNHLELVRGWPCDLDTFGGGAGRCVVEVFPTAMEGRSAAVIIEPVQFVVSRRAGTNLAGLVLGSECAQRINVAAKRDCLLLPSAVLDSGSGGICEDVAPIF